jgi:hypothetical protein
VRETMNRVSSDWTDLVGCTVEVRISGKYLRKGVVEAVSNDSSMMWLRSDGVDGRQLIMRSDPYEIFLLDQPSGRP